MGVNTNTNTNMSGRHGLLLVLLYSTLCAMAANSLLHAGPLLGSRGGGGLQRQTQRGATVAGAEVEAEVAQDYSKNIMTTYGKYPLTISHGKGCNLFDVNGKRYLDMAAGIATCCLGHGNPALKKAVSDQMDRMHHVSNLYFIPEQGKLAKWLVANSCADKVFFCNSGAEANEGAIKLARKYAHTKLNVSNPVIITALQSFHGRTLSTITATGQPKYQKNFGPLPAGFEYVPYNDVAAIKAKVADIQARGGGSGVAAIMMESLQGEGGIIPGTNEFFQEIRRLCDETGALMIIDEVQTGMGRTGKMWGYEHVGVEPDVFTSAKALGAGVPIGAMLCKDYCNVFEPGDHASTYGGNPLACAAGLVVAEAFDNGLLANVNARSEQFLVRANKLHARFPSVIKQVRGRGLMQGLALHEESDLTAAAITKVLMENGVLVVPAGPKVVRFVPPLVLSAEELDEGMDKVEQAIEKLLK